MNESAVMWSTVL